MEKRATIDEIVLTVLPKLKNGQQPRKQKIMEEIKKIAAPQAGKYWVLRSDPQNVFDFAAADVPALALQNQLPSKPEDQYEHNEILYLLTVLGRSAGFQSYIGKKEQARSGKGGHWQNCPCGRFAIALPCMGFNESVLRMRTSSVP